MAAATLRDSSRWYETLPRGNCRGCAQLLNSASRWTWMFSPAASTFSSIPMSAVGMTLMQASRAPGVFANADAAVSIRACLNSSRSGLKIDSRQYDRRAWRRFGRARKDVADHHWRAQPAAEHRPPVALLRAHGALGQFDEIRVAQIEQKIGGAAIASVGHGLEASQNDLLQRGRGLGSQISRRDRIAPHASAYLSHSRRPAEWETACCELVEDRAERVDVAALVRSNLKELLRRHVVGRSRRAMKLLLQEIGKLLVTRQAKVDQHCLSGRAEKECWPV